MNEGMIKKASDIVNNAEECYMGVIDENGYPNVSTTSSVKSEGIYKVIFSTALDVNKAKRIMKDERASVCYHSGRDNVTLVGKAKVVTDQEAKSKYWVDWFIKHFPGGETDPTYCIIEFVTERISLWVDGVQYYGTIENILKKAF